MNTSIIIPTFNNLAFTKKCLEALEKNTPAEYLRDVLVVDNASTDKTPDFLSKTDWIKPVFNKKNLGFARGCNQGAKKAKGDILILLNNDTEVQPGWIEPLLKELASKNVGACGSKLLFPSGKVQHAGIVISNDYIPRHIYYNEDSDREYVNKTRPFQVVTAACMAVKKDVFDRICGFDEDYLNGMEDVDLCLKIKELGLKTLYSPESVVVHHESVSEGRFKAVNKNEDLFLKKWQGKLEPDEEKYYREDGFGRFYITDRNLRNRFLVSSGRAKTRSVGYRILRFIYISFYRLSQAIKLVLKLDFETLSKKVRKVRDAS